MQTFGTILEFADKLRHWLVRLEVSASRAAPRQPPLIFISCASQLCRRSIFDICGFPDQILFFKTPRNMENFSLFWSNLKSLRFFENSCALID
jgi:hypothetical protein